MKRKLVLTKGREKQTKTAVSHRVRQFYWATLHSGRMLESPDLCRGPDCLFRRSVQLQCNLILKKKV